VRCRPGRKKIRFRHARRLAEAQPKLAEGERGAQNRLVAGQRQPPGAQGACQQPQALLSQTLQRVQARLGQKALAQHGQKVRVPDLPRPQLLYPAGQGQQKHGPDFNPDAFRHVPVPHVNSEALH